MKLKINKDYDLIYYLNDIENTIDKLNPIYCKTGELCIFCHSNEFNGIVGIRHEEQCIIRRLRKLIGAVEDICKKDNEELLRLFKELKKQEDLKNG